MGAMKHINVFLYGPNTSGKSHLLKPLMEVFADCCFLRPAGKGSFPLEELFGAKVCVLQDVRVSTFKLAWDDLLVWFEGEKFTVPIKFCKDKLYAERAPVFISTASKFCMGKQEAERLKVDPFEQGAMMDARFRFFHFPRTLTADEKVETRPCKRCFALWLQHGSLGFEGEQSASAPPVANLPSPASRAAEAITDWIETHGGVLYLSGPGCNLALLADALQWTVHYLPTCGRLLPFIRSHGAVANDLDMVVSVALP